MAKGFVCSNCSNTIIIRFLVAGQVAKCLSCQTQQVVPDKLDEVNEDVPAHPAQQRSLSDAWPSPYTFSNPTTTDPGFYVDTDGRQRAYKEIRNPWIEFWLHPRSVIKWAVAREKMAAPLTIYVLFTVLYMINSLSSTQSFVTSGELDAVKLLTSVLYAISMAILSISGGAFVYSALLRLSLHRSVKIEHVMYAMGWGALPLLVSKLPGLIWMIVSPETHFNISGEFSKTTDTPIASILEDAFSMFFSVWGIVAQIVVVSEVLQTRKRTALAFIMAVAMIIVVPLTIYGLVYAAKN